ncbi:MAG: F0F1 ATP synthase subunit B [Litoreibacter sp.]|nr:F0F1 ATP synthase subunit B [Litoreibacter sp.]
MKKLIALGILAPAPALAAGDVFFSLRNTDFVVLISFLLFVGVLVYLKVPGLIGGLLDKRADNIRSELDEAKALREEAQTILASYERKQKEVAEQAERIIETAKKDAQIAADAAKQDLKESIARRLQAADEQIESAQAAAVKDIRDRAVSAAISAAAEVVAAKTSAADQGKLIDDAIGEVAAKLH